MSILPHDPQKSSRPGPDSPPIIDPDQAAEALKRAIEAHQRRDVAAHLAAKRALNAIGVGVVFQTPSGWEPIHA